MADRRAERTRERLLGAAERLVAREGAHRLTLEAVAREAGMSKGSLLYHFPTKDALITGMMEDLIGAFEGAMGSRLASQRERPGRWSRTYAASTFEEAQGRRDLEVGAGLLAAVANDPTLLAPLQEGYERWQSRAAEDGIDPASATVVRLASDGLWVAELLGLAPPTGDLRRAVLEKLLSITEDAGSSEGDEGA